MKKTILLILIFGSFAFARGTGTAKKEVKNISTETQDYNLERKRSHKRRRKITKPIKGLR